MKSVVSFASGALFGLGLCVSEMTHPAKVRAFLDFSGNWDPSLAWVMAAAVASCALFSWVARRRGGPLLAARFHLAERTGVDARLLSGAAIFGVGWGLCGICPGPGIVSLGTGSLWPLVFVAAMAAGTRAEGAFALVLQRSMTRVPSASKM